MYPIFKPWIQVNAKISLDKKHFAPQKYLKINRFQIIFYPNISSVQHNNDSIL